MVRLLLLFISVPAVELASLIELGRQIGTLATLGLIGVTGMLGAFLARRQGLGVLRQVRAEMAAGRLPAGSIVDGIIILLAGALLITPGILTDAVGFLCLIPASRKIIKTALWRRLERAVRDGQVRVSVHRGEASARRWTSI
ncbi:MAG: FxsA family protein [Candidatus Methylomirabilia bacterium]